MTLADLTVAVILGPVAGVLVAICIDAPPWIWRDDDDEDWPF